LTKDYTIVVLAFISKSPINDTLFLNNKYHRDMVVIAFNANVTIGYSYPCARIVLLFRNKKSTEI